MRDSSLLYSEEWFCECFKEMPYMMEWKHILVISFFGVQGGGGVGRVEGIMWLFSSAFTPNLWENVLKSFENHEKSSTSMKLS